MKKGDKVTIISERHPWNGKPGTLVEFKESKKPKITNTPGVWTIQLENGVLSLAREAELVPGWQAAP